METRLIQNTDSFGILELLCLVSCFFNTTTNQPVPLSFKLCHVIVIGKLYALCVALVLLVLVGCFQGS